MPKSDQVDFVTSAGPPKETRLTISPTGGLLASIGAPFAPAAAQHGAHIVIEIGDTQARIGEKTYSL